MHRGRYASLATPTELPGVRTIYGVYSFPLSGGRDDAGGCHLKSGENRGDGRVWHHDIS